MSEVSAAGAPVNVAIVGLGRATFKDHAPFFAAHRDMFNVVAACDTVKERRTQLAQIFPDSRLFRRYDDMLDERGIDLVLVATRSMDHVGQALAALERGLRVAVESPVSVRFDDVKRLRGAAMKCENLVFPIQRGLFAPEYLLARKAIASGILGALHHVTVRYTDYVRRNDWQATKAAGGGAVYYAMPDIALQSMRLLGEKPIQMWSELMRISTNGDAEDYFYLRLRTAARMVANAEFDGGAVPFATVPAIALRGDRGQFRAMPQSRTGELIAIAPGFRFPRRRASVRQPPLCDMHEDFPVVRQAISLAEGEPEGVDALWRAIYAAVRTRSPFPVKLEEAVEYVRIAALMRNNSNPFGS